MSPQVIKKKIISQNAYICCFSQSFKPYSKQQRTYFINGINNPNLDKPPEYSDQFAKMLMDLGVPDVRTLGVYNGESGFEGALKGIAEVAMEMLDIDVYSSKLTNIILEDLKNEPMEENGEINLIGFSGGGQVALNVANKLNEKANVANTILIGAPADDSNLHIPGKVWSVWAAFDPLSWNFRLKAKYIFAGFITHADYMSDKNMGKTAKIVANIINANSKEKV